MRLTQDTKAVALLLVLPFVWYAVPIFTDARYFLADVMDQYYPWWEYAHQHLKAGRFPLWNPYSLSGLPYHVNPQNALFYPLNLPLFFMSFCDAMVVLRVLHSIVASLGMYFLLRRLGLKPFASLAGGIMFGYGSFMSYEVIYVTYINTMVWFPWQLLLLHRLVRKPDLSGAVTLAMVTATSFLGGMPQVFFFCHLTLLFFLFFMLLEAVVSGRRERLWRVLVWLLAAVLLTIPLTLVLFLPAARFIGFSPRTEPLRYLADIMEYSYVRPAFQSLAFPYYHYLFGAPYPPVQHIYFVEVPYVGMAAVLLALLNLTSKRYRWIMSALLCIACFGVLMSKGVYSGFFPWMFRHIKPFQWFRWPYDYLHMLYPALVIGAAAGLDLLWREPGRYGRRLALVGIPYCALGAVWLPHTVTFAVLAIGAAALLGISLLGERLRGRRLRWILGFAVGAALLADLSWYGCEYRRYMPRSLFELRHFRPVAEFFKEHAPFERVSVSTFDVMYLKGQQDFFYDYFLSVEGDPSVHHKWKTARDWLRSIKVPEVVPQMWAREISHKYLNLEESRWDFCFGFPSQAGMIFGYQGIGGYDPFMFERVRDLYQSVSLTNTWNIFNARYVATPHKIIHDQLIPVFTAERINIYENTGAFPRVMVPRMVRDGMRSEAVLSRLASPDFDPREEVLIEDEVPEASSVTEAGAAGEAGGDARIVNYEPNRVVVEANLVGPAALVLHDVYHPAWTAKVDGRDIRIWRANYAFRACFLPAGRHIVEFRYEPRLFYFSAAVSSVFWVLCLAWIAWRAVRGRGGGGTPPEARSA
ncbi:hypothetical protein ACFLSJ_05335 [Verrucomicrobiota bacterium]